jgi:hypothetical protein
MSDRQKIIAGIVFALTLFFQSPFASADGLSVTVTPPLIQLTIGPGDNWTSAIKVVNNNSYDVTYFSQVLDMEANGETGQSKFIPILGKPDPSLAASELARWITLPEKPITIKAGASADLQFSVRIPETAEPGGHYAAILVGTQPLGSTTKGSLMKVSTYVSSLIFVRIKGDVVESGRIREFTSDKTLYQTPKADFVLRFENLGNTHLKPEGDVTIYNMWGKQRGQVLINQDANFGNVLPKSIRRFEFSWEADENVFDIGRYSAVVTLAYGQDSKKNISATTYFWVVPVVPVATTIGTVTVFLILIAWFIRRYIRRALLLERERYGAIPMAHMTETRAPIMETIIEPLKEGVVDLRQVARGQKVPQIPASIPIQEIERGLSFGQFVKKYQLFFVFLLVLIICVVATWIYLSKVLIPERNYHIKSVTSQVE